jgi:hypothetical protein
MIVTRSLVTESEQSTHASPQISIRETNLFATFANSNLRVTEVSFRKRSMASTFTSFPQTVGIANKRTAVSLRNQDKK